MIPTVNINAKMKAMTCIHPIVIHATTTNASICQNVTGSNNAHNPVAIHTGIKAIAHMIAMTIVFAITFWNIGLLKNALALSRNFDFDVLLMNCTNFAFLSVD